MTLTAARQTSALNIEFDTTRFDPLLPSAVRHGLSGHPLLERSSLIKLAERLKAPGRVNYISGKAAPDSDFTQLLGTHGTGRSLEETLDRIEEPGSWIGFYHIEGDPVYRELVDACLSAALPLVERYDPGMHGRCGWIFFSSPGAITPYHIDSENNFLLQVHGEKTLRVWNPADRTVLPEKALETFLARGVLDDLAYQDDFQERAHRFDLSPGEGAYMPFTAPHWAQTGDTGYSITLAVTYYTKATERRSRVYQANSLLRKMKMKPRQAGVSAFSDTMKFHLYQSYLSGKQILKRKPAEAGE